jgi:CheY-like chemotaxis protein
MQKEANILLVEDNEMDVILTLNAFEEAKLTNKVNVVNNGEDALRYLFGEDKYSDRETYPLPDIILLDIKMPGISGLDVLKKIKNTEKLKRIPVIILTSSNEEFDRAESYDNRVNSYLVKPVNFEGLVNVVKTINNYWFTLNVKPPM